jgi:hypothetical protein
MGAAVVAPAAIQGAAQVGSAVMGGKGADRVAKTQAASYDKALDFQRQQQDAADWRYHQAMALWMQGRQQLLKRYGIDMGPLDMGASPLISAANSKAGSSANTGIPGQDLPQTQVPSSTPPQSSPGTNGSAASGYTASNLGDILSTGDPSQLASWSDWKRYGLGT